ncbi:DJ-1/PfpI family protein [Patescibacteria group bacterium]|nr:DJ-1/PfpI family protein [Patescibacteria group bacterium]MBU1016331.1 DJ-1/PfpI family protein [Patescibacteria group bacterium]MBU1685034.1 DJ-1/PfpI family protein [Patescibacteria group bacterium]MBU1938842.1 DJ-1/PfpI family protein [Patescibacteria group bacterium]
MAKVLSIVAHEKFQQVEYLESKRAIEEKGHEVVTASTHQIAFDKLDQSYKVDILLDEVMEGDFDAVLFVGGPGSHAHFDDEDFHAIARAFFEAGKPTTAICAAPVILGRAGLLKGKKVTCFPSQSEDLIRSGAEYTGEHVERDGLIITADGPASAYDFGLAVAEAL